MADTKITALTAIGANPIIPSTFPIPMVDLSDTSMAASGTTKKVTVNQILGAGGTATLASATITGDLTVKTNVLKVDTTNNRVGIGTASPHEILTVANAGGNVIQSILTSATGTGNIFFATSTAGVNSYRGYLQYDQSLNSLAFGINSTTAMTLNSTGLGVGVSPSASLDIQGNASTGANNSTTGALTRMRDIYTRFRANSAGISGDVYAAQLFSGGNAAFEIYSMTSYPLVFGTAATERMRIDSSGNLILQSSATPATLTVNGQLTVNATSNTNLRFSYRGSDGTTRTADITLA